MADDTSSSETPKVDSAPAPKKTDSVKKAASESAPAAPPTPKAALDLSPPSVPVSDPQPGKTSEMLQLEADAKVELARAESFAKKIASEVTERAKVFIMPLHHIRGLRPEVLAYARLMEQKMQAFDSTKLDQWVTDTTGSLVTRLHEEANELDNLVNREIPPTKAEIQQAAADVGNFAMMIVDNLKALDK